MVRLAAVLLLLSTVLATPVRAAEAGAAPSLTEAAVAAVALGPETRVPAPRFRVPPPSRSLVLPALYVSLSALQAYDVYSTLTGVQRGAREANPVLQGVVGHPAAFVALKAGVTGASIYLAERLWKDKKRTQALLLMVASNGLMAYVAHHNARVLRSMP